EKTARPFYTDAQVPEASPDRSVRLQADQDRGVRLQPDHDIPAHHVIAKNLQLLHVLGVEAHQIRFPLAAVASTTADDVRAQTEGTFALLNPGAAWPNKRWPAERFGELAIFLRDVREMTSVVLWGPGEQDLAEAVVRASSGAARAAPPTRLGDLLELARDAALMVSGDTGPL